MFHGEALRFSFQRSKPTNFALFLRAGLVIGNAS